MSPRPDFCAKRARAAPARPDAEPEVVGIRLPVGAYRTPRAVVTVRLGKLLIDFTVARLQSKKLVVRPPIAVDGKPALAAPAGVQAGIEAAVLSAVARDPKATAALRYRFWRPAAARGDSDAPHCNEGGHDHA